MNETSACVLNTGFRALQSYRELFTPNQFDNYINCIICILCISLCFTSVLYIVSRCITVPDYICCIYAVLDLKTKCFVYSLFIKIKLFGVHLNPYKSLLFQIGIHLSLSYSDRLHQEKFEDNRRVMRSDK